MGPGTGAGAGAHDWGAAARRWDHSKRVKVAHQAGALIPASPAWGFSRLGHGTARAEAAAPVPEGTLGSGAPDLEADAGSDQFLGTRLSDPDFGSGFQASLPWGLKLYVDPRIS